MYRLQNDTEQTHYEMKRDPLGISSINFPQKMNSTADKEFYQSDKKHSQIINIIVPEGIRNTLDINVGDPNLKLCTEDLLHCFRARVVMTTKKFPGFDSSSYQYVVFTKPSIQMTEGQMKFMIRELSSEPIDNKTLDNLPVSQLNLKLNHDRKLDKNELMGLKSMINTHVDTTKVWILDYREIKSKMDQSLYTMLIFLYMITGLLFLMSFF